MDSTGQYGVNGLYGSFGYRYALVVVDDATAYKWFVVVKSINEAPEEMEPLFKG